MSGVNAAHTPDKAALRSWLPGYLLLALIWGSSFLFIKVGVRELHPMYVALGRVAVGLIVLLAALAVTRGALPRSLRVWGHLTVVGVLGVAVPFTLFSYGEERVSSVLAGIWNATTPLFVLPIAALVMRTERMTARRTVGVGLGFVGVLVVLGVWQGVGGSALTGQLMCLGAATCYGVVIPYVRKFLNEPQASPLAIPAGQVLTATIALLLVAPLVAGAPPAPADLSWEVLASVAALGALGTGLAFVLHFNVIKKAGASTSASVTYLLPVVATVIGVVVLREELHWYQPVGAVVVLAGVAVSQGAVRLPSRRSKPSLTSADIPRDETVVQQS